MTATVQPAIRERRSAGWRSIRLWVVLGAVIVLAGFIIGAPAKGGPPLDPRSSSPDGTKATVLLLRQFNATVVFTTGLPEPGTDVAVVLSDQLTDDRRAALERWVSSGGTLVVADPISDLQRAVGVGRISAPHILNGPCSVDNLADVGPVDTGGSLLLRPSPDARSCFPAEAGTYFLVDQSVGSGHVIGLGGAGVFTNHLLGHADNSVLAVDLLGAGRSNAQIAWLLPSLVGSGHRSLTNLIGVPVKLALVQLIVAFGILALWRSRRLGRPVVESQPVQLAGSELVVAVGNLLARSQSRDEAATVLRGGLRQWLAGRFGLAPGATINDLADAGSARAGVNREELARALADWPLRDDSELVALAQSLEHIRQEVAHGRQ